MKVTPNSVNVIPGVCTFNLEIRDQSNETIELTEKKLKAYFEQVCEEGSNEYSFERLSYHEPAPMSDWVKGAIEESVKELGIDYTVIPSGAFHDSLIMTSVFPTGMIFVPSERGISHSRYELTLDEDIERGAETLLRAILKVDNMNLSC